MKKVVLNIIKTIIIQELKYSNHKLKINNHIKDITTNTVYILNNRHLTEKVKSRMINKYRNEGFKQIIIINTFKFKLKYSVDYWINKINRVLI